MLRTMYAGLALGVALLATPTVTPAQTAREHGHHPVEGHDHNNMAPVASHWSEGGHRNAASPPRHSMTMLGLGNGWQLMGMAQAFPIGTGGEPLHDLAPLDEQDLYLTQPALMVNLASPQSRFVLRTTFNFEAWSQRGGELTYGGWGEGFIDRRHPHTLLHEAMLSFNAWEAPGGSFSLSAGKGFAPYGTDDPMSRPTVKFPTNHHLSQVLERFTVNAVYLHRSGLSVEAGVFGGDEPKGPYDFSNIQSFGNSFSARITQRLGEGYGPFAPWEISASYARIEEGHHETTSVTQLLNAAVRHEQRYGFGNLYALLEASRSEVGGPEEGYYALLAETRLGLGAEGRHQPYYRVEFSTRPEYARDGAPGTPEFYRYDHNHAEILGATRWLTNTIGYGVDLGGAPVSVMPFVELQHSMVRRARGVVDPQAMFGRKEFWSATVGFRLYFGGGSMRMGSYGVLDPMSAAMRPGANHSPREMEGGR